MQLPTIYHYTDFRTFLADYQKARFSFDKEFSRVKICRKLGLPNSRSYFTDVVNGKKLTAGFVERLLDVMKLPEGEARYFRNLVKYNQADCADDREFYFDQLLAFNKTASTVLNGDALDYYRTWRHSAVRAVLDVFDFGGDYAAIGKAVNPPITARRAKESVKLLLRLSMIRKNGSGFYKPLPGTISTGLYAKDDLIRHYQMQILQLARDILAKKAGGENSMTTKLVSVSRKGYERIDRRLKSFLAEVSSIVERDTDPADRVYHLDIQFFPGSRRLERDAS
jgi:uncharacterized protein (TIGR02147 family)